MLEQDAKINIVAAAEKRLKNFFILMLLKIN